MLLIKNKRTEGIMKTFIFVLIFNFCCLISQASEIKLIATGDVMAHMGNIRAAKVASGYDFAQFFGSEVVALLKSGDLVIGNLETRLAGADRGYSGYPAFNAPDDLARDLKNIGFNFLTTANNHVLDRGCTGIIATNKLLTKSGFNHTGSFAAEEAARNISVEEIKGIRVAMLAYTYGTNGIRLPKGHGYMVNYLETAKVISDIKKACSISDFIVVCVHWGDEYSLKENKQQIELAKQMHAAGADLIIGHHPHVVQGSSVSEAGDNQKSGKKVVAYSLGNFISGQSRRNTDEGEILIANIKKDKTDDRAIITSFSLEPTKVSRFIKKGRLSYMVNLAGKD